MIHATGEKSTPREIYKDLKIGINPVAFATLYAEWDKTADEKDRLAARDSGTHHWASIAAMHGGTLPLTVETHWEKEGRTYTKAPFPIQSMPKALRPAVTPVDPGHVLIDLDWKASHWQLLAWRSGDATLINDLKNTDIYTTHFPNIDRSKSKAGFNTVLNGGGLSSLKDTFGSESIAKAFLDAVHTLLDGRWGAAGAYLKTLKQQAVDNGWTTEFYAGGGIHLMRIEAENLEKALSHPKLKEMGMRVILPMHDGVLLSAPEKEADRVAAAVARCMAACSTGSTHEAKTNCDAWVKATIYKSWGGSTTQLIGGDLRAAALKAVKSVAPHDLVIAAALMPNDLESEMKTHAPASQTHGLIKRALAAKRDADRWLRHATLKNSPAPLVDLPHDEPSYVNICKVIREDKSLPRARWNARESIAYIGGREAGDTILRATYLTALETRYGMTRVPETLMSACVVDVARESEYDPVLDYLKGLEWDGTPRLRDWLFTYAKAEVLNPTPAGKDLIRSYGAKWMLSVVARAYQPGCKVDTMLVLMGDQGAKKSTMLRTIAPCGSFAAVQIDPQDKDSVLRASRYAIIEWPELAGASRREQESLKDYFSKQEDRVRPPYARGDLVIPRRAVFAATTNENDFLRDATGSRRYWPFKTGDIDIPALARDRDQLWAEAVAYYNAAINSTDPMINKNIWWLSEDEEKEREAQAMHFTADDPLAPSVWDCIVKNRGRVTLDQVMDHMDIGTTDRPRMAPMITRALKTIGAVSKPVKEKGIVSRKWVYEGDLPDPTDGLPDMMDIAH